MNFFGCRHDNYTWPRGRAPHTYVVCLDCGREMRYDWGAMKILPDKKPVRFQRIEFMGERSK